MGGMEMMLKALGLDPNDLKKRGDELFEQVSLFRAGMEALNATQIQTLQAVLRIENKMGGGLDLPDTELAGLQGVELKTAISQIAQTNSLAAAQANPPMSGAEIAASIARQNGETFN